LNWWEAPCLHARPPKSGTEKEFAEKTEKLFDVAHKEADTLVKISEDISWSDDGFQPVNHKMRIRDAETDTSGRRQSSAHYRHV